MIPAEAFEGFVVAWACATAHVAETTLQELMWPCEERMIGLSDTAGHAVEGDPTNLPQCQCGAWLDRLLVETVLAMLTLVSHFKPVMHRVWTSFHARLACIMAALNVLAQWQGFQPTTSGFMPLAMAKAYTCLWGRASSMRCPPPPPGASALRRARAPPAGCERPRAGGPRGVIDLEAFAIPELPAESGGTTGDRKTQERRPLPRNAMLPLPLHQRGGRQGGRHGLQYPMQEAQPSGSMLRVWPIGDPRDCGTNRPDTPDCDRRIGAPATRMAS